MLKLHIRLSLVWATPHLLLCPSAQAATLVSHLEESPSWHHGPWDLRHLCFWLILLAESEDFLLTTSTWCSMKRRDTNICCTTSKRPTLRISCISYKKSCEVDAMIQFSQVEESWFREIRTTCFECVCYSSPLLPHAYFLSFPALLCAPRGWLRGTKSPGLPQQPVSRWLGQWEILAGDLRVGGEFGVFILPAFFLSAMFLSGTA